MIRNFSIFILLLILAKFIGRQALECFNVQLFKAAESYLLDMFDQVKDIINHLTHGDVFYVIRLFENQTGFYPGFSEITL